MAAANRCCAGSSAPRPLAPNDHLLCLSDWLRDRTLRNFLLRFSESFWTDVVRSACLLGVLCLQHLAESPDVAWGKDELASLVSHIQKEGKWPQEMSPSSVCVRAERPTSQIQSPARLFSKPSPNWRLNGTACDGVHRQMNSHGGLMETGFLPVEAPAGGHPGAGAGQRGQQTVHTWAGVAGVPASHDTYLDEEGEDCCRARSSSRCASVEDGHRCRKTSKERIETATCLADEAPVSNMTEEHREVREEARRGVSTRRAPPRSGSRIDTRGPASRRGDASREVPDESRRGVSGGRTPLRPGSRVDTSGPVCRDAVCRDASPQPPPQRRRDPRQPAKPRLQRASSQPCMRRATRISQDIHTPQEPSRTRSVRETSTSERCEKRGPVQIAEDFLQSRLSNIFCPDSPAQRPCRSEGETPGSLSGETDSRTSRWRRWQRETRVPQETFVQKHLTSTRSLAVDRTQTTRDIRVSSDASGAKVFDGTLATGLEEITRSRARLPHTYQHGGDEHGQCLQPHVAQNQQDMVMEGSDDVSLGSSATSSRLSLGAPVGSGRHLVHVFPAPFA
uniref:Uncharacterized protein n=1 Tax=Noctiluca scintillans TaxID=2966 RepID=A0A7S1A0R0_NOCSC